MHLSILSLGTNLLLGTFPESWSELTKVSRKGVYCSVQLLYTCSIVQLFYVMSSDCDVYCLCSCLCCL